MNKAASWCAESPITNTYVATACPYDHDPLKEPRERVAQQLRIATSAFIERVAQSPLQLDMLDFTVADAWHSLSGQLVKRYNQAHWELVTSDDGYRESLGDACDMFTARNGGRVPSLESAGKKRRRQITELQHMVKGGASEGIPTTVAAYAVVPSTVSLRRPQLDKEHKFEVCTELLPAAGEVGRTLARNSKLGDKHLLQRITHPAQTGAINYKKLSYDPAAFDVIVDERHRLSLRLIQKHLEPIDTKIRFRGCPALLYGSVVRINHFIADIIKDHKLYAQALIK